MLLDSGRKPPEHGENMPYEKNTEEGLNPQTPEVRDKPANH